VSASCAWPRAASFTVPLLLIFHSCSELFRELMQKKHGGLEPAELLVALRDEVGGSAGAREGVGTCSWRPISRERVWSCSAAGYGRLPSLGEPLSSGTA